ncbi:MAG: helix-turn-helix domain containing protein [Chloroflexi bacterium]|nr:helix-turn-helix domain containing protein [Chloroflexota bacterium]
MSFPTYPNPARRARILEAQQLRMQALTMREIAQRMHCSVSTVHAYLRDYELFRADLIQELAADQIVANLIQLGDSDDPHHDQHRADLHELRLLLTSLPQIRRDESDRSVELLQTGIAVDRYGNRYSKTDRLHPPTAEETEQMQQVGPPVQDLDPDQPLAFLPEPSRTEPNASEQDFRPPPPREVSRSDGGRRPQPADLEADRTDPNKPEQEIHQNPAHNSKSADPDQNFSAPNEQPQPNPVPDKIRAILERSDRDWITDYHPHSPDHPLRLAAIQLKKEREARKVDDAA